MDPTKKKNLLFLFYYGLIIFLICFPGPFDWANRIDPWVLGLPFSSFYMFVCIALLCAGLITQYLVEDKTGELDIDVSMVISLRDSDQEIKHSNKIN